MAKIQTIKNKDNVTVYPQTHTQAVYDANGKKLQEWMNDYLTADEVTDIENVNTEFEIIGNKTNTLNSDSTDIQYPTARATYKLVTEAIASMAGQLKIEVTEALPSEGENSTIYLVLNEDGEENNIYNEYLYLNKKWELIGTTEIDLSNYATNSSVDEKIISHSTKADEKYAKKELYGDTEINLGRVENTKIGVRSATIGITAQATEDCSFAQGNTVTASGYAANATGVNTTASGSCSSARGQYTEATGWTSTAEGYYSQAKGGASHAEGTYVIAGSNNQHVQGKYNIEDASDQYAHIVGNGTEEKRSNAHTIEWNGNAWFQGDVYVKSNSGTNKDEGSKKLATEDMIPNVSNFATKNEIPEVPTAVSELSNDRNYIASAATSPILVKYSWYGTQAQYDALTNIDINTEYNIIEE